MTVLYTSFSSNVIKIVLSSYYNIVRVVISDFVCVRVDQGGNPIGKALVRLI